MKISIKIAALMLCFATLFGLCSCEASTKNYTFYGSFDTVSTFYDYTGGLSVKKFDKLCERVESELLEYHRLYDIYNEYEGITNLATLNKNAGKGPQKVDAKIINMLLYSKEMYGLTGGKVNVAIGAVTKIWHDYRKDGESIPPMEMLLKASEHTDINNLVINEKDSTVELKDSEMSLDVGAIAKGYAVEAVASGLLCDGYSGYVLDVGRNIRTIGEKPNSDGWTCGVTNPDWTPSQTYVYKTVLKNQSMSTSGSYERFYTVDGVNYHHIINGDTLMPENYYLSVSIRADSSALTDALSTAVFNMQPEEAKEFIEKLPGVFAVFVMPNGNVVTAGKE